MLLCYIYNYNAIKNKTKTSKKEQQRQQQQKEQWWQLRKSFSRNKKKLPKSR